MRSLKPILFATLVLAIVTSCNLFDFDHKIENETIIAKWNVENSDEYESFEFNESGNYIVVKNTATKSTNNQKILFGTYEITSDQKINLSDFGTLTISEISDSTISFSIILTGNFTNEPTISALKQEEIESSTKTDLLCRTWEMVYYNKTLVAGTDSAMTVLFSKAGTYFVTFANPSEENLGGLAHWKWKNDKETHLLFSWEETPNWEEEEEDEGYVEIPELTETSLKIIEDDDTYILQPISKTKSAIVQSSKNSVWGLKAGFIGNK